MSDLAEIDLIDRARTGDRDALEAIVSAHRESVLRFLRTLTSDDAAAEDALQETFIAAVTHVDQFRSDGTMRAWLFTIAKRTAIRSQRRRAGEPEHLEPLDVLGQNAGWGAENCLEHKLLARDAVRIAFSTMSNEDREVLVLRDVEGFSAEEAAVVLGVGVPAFKSRLHRARLRFAAKLREGDDDGARS